MKKEHGTMKENQVKYNEPVARYGVGWLAGDSVYVVG